MRTWSSEFHSLIISSTLFPVISDGNLGVGDTVVVRAEDVPLLDATAREEDVCAAAVLGAVELVFAAASVDVTAEVDDEKLNTEELRFVGCDAEDDDTAGVVAFVDKEKLGNAGVVVAAVEAGVVLFAAVVAAAELAPKAAIDGVDAAEADACEENKDGVEACAENKDGAVVTREGAVVEAGAKDVPKPRVEAGLVVGVVEDVTGVLVVLEAVALNKDG